MLTTLGSSRFSRVDPSAEFSRIRHSLNLLESHILQNTRNVLPTGTSASPPNTAIPRNASQRVPSGAARKLNEVKDLGEKDADLSGGQSKTGDAPGMLGQSDPSGFYAGPTSTLSHLIAVSIAPFSPAALGLTMYLVFYPRRVRATRRPIAICGKPLLFSPFVDDFVGECDPCGESSLSRI